MVTDYDGNILMKMGDTEGRTKCDIYPKQVEAIRDERISNNYLYQLKHRGYTGVPPMGKTENPFSIYRDWDEVPERWNRAPDEGSETIAKVGRDALEKAAEDLKKSDGEAA